MGGCTAYACAWFLLAKRGGGVVAEVPYAEKQCYEQTIKYDRRRADAWAK